MSTYDQAKANLLGDYYEADAPPAPYYEADSLPQSPPPELVARALASIQGGNTKKIPDNFTFDSAVDPNAPPPMAPPPKTGIDSLIDKAVGGTAGLTPIAAPPQAAPPSAMNAPEQAMRPAAPRGSGGGGIPDAFKAGFHLDEIPITKETREAQRLAGSAYKEAIDREGMVQAGFELSKQEARDQYLTKADELEKKTNAILQVKAQAAEDANKTLQTYSDDIQNTKIDPSRLFSSTNALQLAMFGMASVLSTVGKGDPMVGFNAMERAIDRDIDAQKADLATKKSGFDRQNQLYGKMLAKFEDPIQATEAAKIALRHQLAGQMESLGNQSQSQTILNNKDAAIAKFNEDTANKQAQLEQMVHISKQQQYATQARMSGAGGGGMAPGSMKQIMAKQDDYRERWNPTLGGFAPSKEVNKRLTEGQDGLARAKDSLLEIKKLVASPETRANPGYRGKMNTAIRNYSQAMGPVSGTGVMSEPEFERQVGELKSLISLNPVDMMSGSGEAVLDASMAFIDDMPNRMRRVHRIESGTVQAYQNPQSGITTELYIPTGQQVGGKAPIGQKK
jgi:hypothetical protein